MKMDHGTIAMWKNSLILITFVFLMVYGIFAFSDASKTYWESVGPDWDRMLNPCNYTECTID